MPDAMPSVGDTALHGGLPRSRDDHVARPADAAPVSADHPVRTPLAALWLRALLIFAIGFVTVLAIFHETVLDLLDGWGRTGTYAHGYIIFPVSAWLIWRSRHVLVTVTPKPQPLALVPLVAFGAAWLVAQTVGVHAPAQYAFVAMVPCLVWAVFGDDVTKRILYPLGFLFFAVPAGDFLMPTLMDHTADFTVQALRASGVPVFREGNYFQIPSGNWSVVEACSGLRYLIASITLGFLFAYLNYRAAWRRLAFIVASILVPIVANWLRAYMIVMIAHTSSNRLATGVDHIIYGWLFFGLVMMLLFWVGNFWRDDDSAFDEPAAVGGSIGVAPPRRTGAFAIVAAAFVLLAAPWPVVGMLLEAQADGPRPGRIAVDGIAGWQGGAESFTTFRPHYVHPRSTLDETFASGDRRVGLFLAYYSGQLDNGLMVTYENDVVIVADKQWGSVAQRVRTVPLDGEDRTVVENDVVSQVTSTERLKTWRWYWINGRLTTSKVLAKIYTAVDKLTGRGDDSAVIVLTTPVGSNQGADAAEASLRAFAIAAEPRIRAGLAAVHDEARR